MGTQCYSGRAVAAICVAVTTVTLGVGGSLLTLLLGPLAIVLALAARRDLRARPGLQGWGLSLAAMSIGVVVTLLVVWPFVASGAFAFLAALPLR